jgi:hypothetical protein
LSSIVRDTAACKVACKPEALDMPHLNRFTANTAI